MRAFRYLCSIFFEDVLIIFYFAMCYFSSFAQHKHTFEQRSEQAKKIAISAYLLAAILYIYTLLPLLKE